MFLWESQNRSHIKSSTTIINFAFSHETIFFRNKTEPNPILARFREPASPSRRRTSSSFRFRRSTPIQSSTRIRTSSIPDGSAKKTKPQEIRNFLQLFTIYYFFSKVSGSLFSLNKVGHFSHLQLIRASTWGPQTMKRVDLA